MKKNSNEGTCSSCLPDCLLLEILYLLPPKSVIRFQSVSKQWLALISDFRFAFDYVSRWLSLRQLKHPPYTLLCQTMHVEGSYREYNEDVYDLLSSIHQLGFSQPLLSFSTLTFPQMLQNKEGVPLHAVCDDIILQSSNGLLLCCSQQQLDLVNLLRHYYICNPVTRQWIEIPDPAPPLSLKYVGGVGFITLLEGFATVTSYKIVILRSYRSIVKFEVFSSETGVWEVHQLVPVPSYVDFGSKYCRSVETSERILHWFDGKSSIVAYRPYFRTDSYCVTRLPQQDGTTETYCKQVDAFHGMLRYLEVFRQQGFHLRIWRLQDYNSESDNWRLDCAIALRGSLFYYPSQCYEILGLFSDSGIMYVRIRHERQIFSYDIHTMELTPDSHDKRQETFCSRFILKLPIWPTKIKCTSSPPQVMEE